VFFVMIISSATMAKQSLCIASMPGREQ